jgi:hypothetical protein
MQKKNRTVLIPLVGILVGVLEVAVALPGREGASPGTGARHRVGQAFVDRMGNLGLLPVRCCCPSRKNACIANLKCIDGAKATWALENKRTLTDVPTATDLYGTNAYIRDEPTCPAGGKYLLGSVQQKPRCSMPGHTL